MTDELTANAKITWSAKRNVAGSKAADVLVATKSAYKDRLKAWRSVVLLSEEQLASLEESLGDKRYNRKNFNDAVKALRQQDGKTGHQLRHSIRCRIVGQHDIVYRLGSRIGTADSWLRL